MVSTTSLRCLGRLQVEWADASQPRAVAPDTRPMELLLRVAAAGPGGPSATMLCAAMWPHVAPGARHRALRATMRRLDRSLALRDALLLDGNRVTVNRHALAVDSLDLEAAIAPLLNPFALAGERECERARAALASPAAKDAGAFMPESSEPWAVQARLRIADAVERAQRALQPAALEIHE